MCKFFAIQELFMISIPNFFSGSWVMNAQDPCRISCKQMMRQLSD